MSKPRATKFDLNSYTPLRFGTKPEHKKIIIEYRDENDSKTYHHSIKLEKYVTFEKIHELLNIGKSLSDPFFRNAKEFDAHAIEKEIEGFAEDIKDDRRHQDYFRHSSIKNEFLPCKCFLIT